MAAGRWTRGKAIALATLIGGTLDLTAASLLSGQPAQHLLQTIASALISDRAFADGWASTIGGLVLHYAIALAMAALFMLAFAPRRPVARQPLVAGALYGAACWAVMYLVVLPLRWPDRYPSFGLAETTAQIACHVLLVGLSIGWAASRLRR
jgi:hypothetical protein